MRPDDEPGANAAHRDRALLAAIDAALRPAAMHPARAAHFERGVAERIARPAPRLQRWAPALLASAAAAAALWLALPREPVPGADDLVDLVYAVDEGESAAELNEHLPEDYQLLSAVLETDSDEP